MIGLLHGVCGMSLGLFLGLLFVCGIFGIVGSAIAEHKKASAAAGFWLGFFLGPIGMVIAALLGPTRSEPQGVAPNRTLDTSSTTTRPESTSLEDARYKVWLVENYAITKNDVLGEYLCGDRSFQTISDALEYAHAEETAKRALEEQVRQKREAEWQAEKEKRIAKQAIDDARATRAKKWGALIISGLVIGISIFTWKSATDHREAAQAQRAAEQERISEVLSQIGLVLEEMPTFSIRATPRSSFCDDKAGILYTSFPGEAVLGDARKKLWESASWVRRPTMGYINGLVVRVDEDASLLSVCDVGGVLPGAPQGD